MRQATYIFVALLLILAAACAVLAWRRSVARASITPADAGYRVDLNSADAATIALLPGIGPHLAQRIVDDRKQRGPFATVDDLARVKGVGQHTLARVRLFAVASPPQGYTDPQ